MRETTVVGVVEQGIGGGRHLSKIAVMTASPSSVEPSIPLRAARWRHASLWCTAAALALLAGCGQRGPLQRVDARPAALSASAVTPASAPSR
uniref:LPS translocon maturation chaperone LptM n=1 Tax=Ideonella aquatica TaxID=2824119 RepID=UPI0035BF01A7